MCFLFCWETLADILRAVKEDRRGRIREYKDLVSNEVQVLNSKDIWSIKCDIAFPCATQFELDDKDARKLIDNGCIGVLKILILFLY